VLTTREQRIESRLLEGGADARPYLGAFADDVIAGNARRSRGRREQRRQHVDGRGLPGAVRAEEAEDLAGGDGQVDRVDRARPLLELADQLLCLDRGLAHGP
jgi:hypothetical protein